MLCCIYFLYFVSTKFQRFLSDGFQQQEQKQSNVTTKKDLQGYGVRGHLPNIHIFVCFIEKPLASVQEREREREKETEWER